MSNNIVGLQVLGFQGYSKKHAKLVLDALKGLDVQVLAFLYNSFGTKKDNILAWYEQCDENSITQVYISNEVDRRKRREDTNSMLYKKSVKQLTSQLEKEAPRVMKAIEERIREIYDFHQEHGKGELRIALGLESQWTRKALATLTKIARKAAPGTILIHNPVNSSPFKGKGKCDIIEFHGMGNSQPKGRYVCATDGYNICPGHCLTGISGPTLSSSDIVGYVKKFSNADYFLIWSPEFNSLSKDSQNLPAPSQRKSVISESCMKHLRKYVIDQFDNHSGKAKPKDPVKPPAEVKGCKKLLDPFKTNNFVWKESDHGGLVVVFPSRFKKLFSKVEVIQPNGKRFKLYETGWANPDSGGERQHWRHKRSSHKFPKNSILRATAKRGWFDWLKRKKRHTFCWLIKEPAIRNGK